MGLLFNTCEIAGILLSSAHNFSFQFPVLNDLLTRNISIKYYCTFLPIQVPLKTHLLIVPISFARFRYFFVLIFTPQNYFRGGGALPDYFLNFGQERVCLCMLLYIHTGLH